MVPQRMLKVAIVDDEPIAVQRLRRMLAQEAGIAEIAEAGDGSSAISMILEKRPDLILLDVQLPDVDGFGVLEAVTQQYTPRVIFVTAYDEFAVKAFEANAIDYLLKPFDTDRFRAALRKAHRDFDIDSREKMERITAVTRQDRLVIKVEGRYVMLRPRDLDMVEAAGNYVVIHAGSQRHMVRETMASFEQRLSPERFVRVHRSVIVNVDRILEMAPTYHGEYVITLVGGKKVTLSRTFRHRLRKLLR